MLEETIQVLAGNCIVVDDDGREEHRGRITAVIKPDNTVLVHDSEGYRPVAWLTRADSVSTTSGPPEEFTLIPHKGETTLRLAAHDRDGFS